MRYLLLLFLAMPSFGASWYVDSTASGANNGTSWTDAWQTFSNVIWGVSGVNSGDTLYISGGSAGSSKVYSMTNFVVGGYESVLLIGGASGFSASEASPFTISTGQDAGHNGMVILDGTNLSGSDGNSHIVVVAGGNNFRLTGNVGGLTNMMIRGSVGGANREWRKGYFGGSGSGQTIDHVIFTNLNNGIHYSSVPATNVEISLCSFVDIRGDSAITHGGGGDVFDQVRIRQNYMLLNAVYDPVVGGGPDGIKPRAGTTMWSNEIYNTTGTIVAGQHPDAIQFAQGGNYCKIYANKMGAFYNAIFEAGTAQRVDQLWVYNNVCFGTDTNQISGGHPVVGECGGEYVSTLSVSNVFIFNNTFVDFDGGFGWTWDKDGSTPTVNNFRFMNNLLLNCNRNRINWTVGFGETTNANVTVGTHLIVDYNLIARSTSATNNLTNNIIVGGFSAGAYYIYQSHPLTNIPNFVSYTPYSTANNFRPVAISDLQGTNLSSYFTTDADGRTRSLWSVGAFEPLSMNTNQPAPVGGFFAMAGRFSVAGRVRIGPESVPPLDEIPDVAQGAYSVARRLTNGWTSALAMVIRQSDSATNYVVAQNETNNISAILSWAGTNHVYVTNLYDQSGHGRTLTITNVVMMPRIVTNGVHVQKNGRTVMRFDPTHLGDYDRLDVAASFSLPISHVFAVCQLATTGQPIIAGAALGITNCAVVPSAITPVYGLDNGTRVNAGSYTLDNWDVLRVVFDTTSTIAVDGGSITTASAGANTTTALSIGSPDAGVHGTADMLFGDWVVFNVSLSEAEQQRLRDNINQFYGIY